MLFYIPLKCLRSYVFPQRIPGQAPLPIYEDNLEDEAAADEDSPEATAAEESEVTSETVVDSEA